MDTSVASSGEVSPHNKSRLRGNGKAEASSGTSTQSNESYIPHNAASHDIKRVDSARRRAAASSTSNSNKQGHPSDQSPSPPSDATSTESDTASSPSAGLSTKELPENLLKAPVTIRTPAKDASHVAEPIGGTGSDGAAASSRDTVSGRSSSSTDISGSGQMTATANGSTGSSVDSTTQSNLDFAKRDLKALRRVSKSLAGSYGSEHSNLGSRLNSVGQLKLSTNLRGSGSSNENGNSAGAVPSTSDDDDTPALHADDGERIRAPASAHPSRQNSQEIGLRQPFTSSQSEGANPSQRPPRKAKVRSWDLETFTRPQRQRHYEPARFMLQVENTSPADGSSASSSADASKAGTPTKRGFPDRVRLELRRPHRIIPSPDMDDLSRAKLDVRMSDEPLRQLREPRHPLYIPAVLRPTQPQAYTGRQERLAPYTGSGPVAAPGRLHWQPDSSRKTCFACDRPFTSFTRRHHCRKCGFLFCNTDSKHTIGLGRDLSYSLFGFPCRACTSCAEDFDRFASSALRLRDVPSLATAVAQPTVSSAAPPTSVGVEVVADEGQTFVGSLVNTDWSTF